MNEIQTTEIKQIELEILFYKKQTVQSIFEIGNRLIKAKELVPFGEWTEWLERKVDFSQWQANKFMRIAREFSNYGAHNNLGFEKLFILTSIEEEEREEFIKDNPVEDMTTRELRQVIKDKKELEKKVEELENKEPAVIEKEKIVAPSDYNYYKDATHKLQGTVSELSRESADNKVKLSRLESEKNLLERKVKLNEDDSNKYKQLKSQIENLSKQKDDLGRRIKSVTELSGLVVRVEHMLKTELAPIKYSRAISEASTDEMVTRNLKEIIDRVQDWCNEMYQYTTEENIIDSEVIGHE